MEEGRTPSFGEADRAARLKSIVDRLAAGTAPAEVKKEFHELIKGADAAEVAALEQSLIEAGTPVEEVQRLCEVHADVFRAGLERGERPDRMPGHPVHSYLAENREARRRSRSLAMASWRGIEAMKLASRELKPILIHYTRKENQLFPFLERSGFTGPSKVMWGKHDEIRSAFKELDAALAAQDAKGSRRLARELARKIGMMAFMEERILFPNALKRLSERDWAAVRLGEEAIGFAWIKPGATWDPAIAGSEGPYAHLQAAVAAAPADSGGAGAGPSLGPGTPIPLSVGSIPLEALDRILKALPVDISFVDAEDKLRYYSDAPERVFPRSPGVIGRDVRDCHPHKSVAIVERILASFKAKEKKEARFWIQMGERFILIDYKAIYDEEGRYLGTLETSMDATEIRKLEGQRRLLDW
ncbi:MAG TPA: DUF438 domain-containing protein [Spirochaetia bacterium]|nr:DUF438 domain-containing protein [Spirochaetia bacterium]HRZ66181.1 DUF438 domain-containing protein [Spirochaetia bacterium]